MTRQDLPSHIQIGVFRYELVHWPAAEAEAVEQFGECDHTRKKIKVRDDVDDATFAETLEHEMGHACWYACGLKSRATEERVISLFTPFLMMARRDNPQIYDWIEGVLARPCFSPKAK
jgi:hypothetical protein